MAGRRPEQALAMVEVLPALPAVSAVDWPKGQAVRVVSRRYGATGGASPQRARLVPPVRRSAVDERLVLNFDALLRLAQHQPFRAHGQRRLCRAHRSAARRLSDLAVGHETDKQGARIPRLAAAWLDDVLEGIDTKTDKEFRSAIEKLRGTPGAQPSPCPRPCKPNCARIRKTATSGPCVWRRPASAPVWPTTWAWARRCRRWRVLLARADDGPALVIAPTSVCGNWIAESRALRAAASMCASVRRRRPRKR